MPITPEILDEILKDYEKPEDLLSQDGLLQQLTKALVERALNGEMTHYHGYEKHSPAGNNSGNSRNGTTAKTLKGKRGQIEIEVPRDRNAEFEPQIALRQRDLLARRAFAALAFAFDISRAFARLTARRAARFDFDIGENCCRRD
jgi:transposase-like protein